MAILLVSYCATMTPNDDVIAPLMPTPDNAEIFRDFSGEKDSPAEWML